MKVVGLAGMLGGICGVLSLTLVVVPIGVLNLPVEIKLASSLFTFCISVVLLSMYVFRRRGPGYLRTVPLAIVVFLSISVAGAFFWLRASPPTGILPGVVFIVLCLLFGLVALASIVDGCSTMIASSRRYIR